jgi:hypothetical protein
MTEYHWHTVKDRIYLCNRPEPTHRDKYEALPRWEEWIGFYRPETHAVCIRHGPWPNHKYVATLDPTMTLNAALDTAKIILLSLKQSEEWHGNI